MKADSLFGSLANSSMRLSTGLLLSLGLVVLLIVTNFRAIVLLLDSEQEKANSHFARVMENVREQEVFLQAISDRLAAPSDQIPMAPASLKRKMQFSDLGNSTFDISESAFSLPFTVTVPDGESEQGLNAILTLGWHLTNYYSWFWAQSNYLSPQVFLFSPESTASVAMPAIGKFRNENLLTRQNYSLISRSVAGQTMKQSAPLQDRKVHWTQPGPPSQPSEDKMEVVAYMMGELPIHPVRVDSGMDHVVVASLFDLRHLSASALDSDLPFHGQFTLISPKDEVLTGRLEMPVQRPGISLSKNGLLISTVNVSIKNERWAGQYFVDYGVLARWAAFPLLRLLGLSLLLFFCFRWLYHYYRTQIVMPARHAQAQLVESQAFNQAIIESAPAGLVVIRRSDGKVVIENQRAQTRLAVSQAIVKMLRKPGVTLSGEACMALQDRYYLVNYASTRYQEQDVLLCAFSDVTEHQQRSVALHQAKREAEKANEAKTIFLATMSHEIRTPLYGVLGTLELLGLTRLDKRQHEYLQTMQTSSATVLQIISDVLDVSKIESGQLALESVPFCPLDLIENVVSSHIAGARSKDLQIYACIDPAIPVELQGDEVKIGQILNNLLGNAIKFTAIGRVVVRCRVSKEEGQDLTLEFQVADTGIGITPEQQTHIFQPFYQAHTSNLVSGTGLGLSICSRFVEMMGGDIAVISEQGLGSSFTVSLPFRRLAACLPKTADIELNGRQVYVRAPVRELADNVCAWLNRWGGCAAVVSDRSNGMLADALLVDVLGGGERPFTWKGKQLICDHNGPQAPEFSETAYRVSAHHVRAIAAGVLMATNVACASTRPTTNSSLPSLDLRVLVAEDNLINQAILKEQLEALGCSAVVAGNGHQALQIWEQDKFDVVLSDVNMPVLNGYELARAIRAKNGEIPIIGITANAMRDEGERCQSAGMNACMVKPLSLTDLLDAFVSLKLNKQDPVVSTTVPAVTEPGSIRPTTLALSDAMRRLFHSTMEKDIEAIRQAVTTRAQADAVHILHSVSGALSVVRADELSAEFGRLEYKVRDQPFDSLLIAEIDRALDRLSDLLKSI
ncbi:ATP-binding protein [Pseudomonas baetica]|uniref:hybrid sensor histidine kinase/response regulator n=1 Tax=Pseudomonas baetica TaxID=674054 RepID=UPI003EEEC609